ncbi:hypothetical protein H4582DRAFT_1529139 [Lactarius indigo]|nr:hypothetical protein H4582DRAFT_1529139 [Lactarius indigo]
MPIPTQTRIAPRFSFQGKSCLINPQLLPRTVTKDTQEVRFERHILMIDDGDDTNFIISNTFPRPCTVVVHLEFRQSPSMTFLSRTCRASSPPHSHLDTSTTPLLRVPQAYNKHLAVHSFTFQRCKHPISPDATQTALQAPNPGSIDSVDLGTEV